MNRGMAEDGASRFRQAAGFLSDRQLPTEESQGRGEEARLGGS